MSLTAREGGGGPLQHEPQPLPVPFSALSAAFALILPRYWPSIYSWQSSSWSERWQIHGYSCPEPCLRRSCRVIRHQDFRQLPIDTCKNLLRLDFTKKKKALGCQVRNELSCFSPTFLTPDGNKVCLWFLIVTWKKNDAIVLADGWRNDCTLCSNAPKKLLPDMHTWPSPFLTLAPPLSQSVPSNQYYSFGNQYYRNQKLFCFCPCPV